MKRNSWISLYKQAPEDVIYVHLKNICENKNLEEKFGKAIVLPTYHHVSHVSHERKRQGLHSVVIFSFIFFFLLSFVLLFLQRFFIDWFHVYTLAPSLLERIEKQTLEDIKRQISNCFMKLYHLCDYISRAMRDGVSKDRRTRGGYTYPRIHM